MKVMSKRGALIAWSVLIAAAASPAWGEDKKPDLCKAEHIDHRKLANHLLDKAAVPRSAESEPTAQLSGAEATLADDQRCAKKNGQNTCEQKVADSLNVARNYRDEYLKRYLSGNRIAASSFFADPSVVLRCDSLDLPAQDAGQIASLLPISPNVPKPFRLRADPTSLIYGRDEPITKTVSKASISFSDDGTANKTSEKIVGVVGWEYNFRLFGSDDQGKPNGYQGNGRVGLVPYVGVNEDFSKAIGKGQSTTASYYNVGISALTRYQSGSLLNVIAARSDLLLDTVQHDHILSLDLSYTPFVHDRLNNFLLTPISVGPAKIAIAPLLELHLRPGWYLQTGKANLVNPKRDFARLGPKFGFALSDNQLAGKEIVLTVLDYHLLGLRGTPRDIDYFTTILSLPLVKDGLVAIDLSYANGRKDDTYKRVQTWQAALSARY